MVENYASDLFERAVKGDSQAFVSLIQSHQDGLRALAFSVVRDPSVLDDVMQESFIKAFRSVGKVRDVQNFKSWIHRIVYTTAIDEVRHRSSVIPFDAEAMPEARHGGSSMADRAAARQDINTALWQLSPPQRAAVLLIDAHGFDYETAAEILGAPPGTIASRVSNARLKLRHLLSISEMDAK